MPDDRRTVRRVRLPGVEVTYEGATGDRQQARVVDLSREGLFVPSPTPLQVGKRLSLEIQPIGEPVAWSALGRVVWIRETDEGDERPAGMAVKIIDADDAVLTALGHLLEAREPTDRGLGFGDTILPVPPRARSNPPAREKTMLGVGVEAPPAPAAPILLATPGREPTLLGVGTADEPAATREASLTIDLVTKKPPSVRPATDVIATADPRTSDPPEQVELDRAMPAREGVAPDAKPSEAPRRRRSGWGLYLLVLVLAGGAAGYVYRDRVFAFWHTAVGMLMKRLG